MSHTLIVLPDDTVSAILDPINAAKRSLNRAALAVSMPAWREATNPSTTPGSWGRSSAGRAVLFT